MLLGEEVSFDGLVKVVKAKLYTLPSDLPLLFCAAISEQTAQWSGSWSDGLLTIVEEMNLVERKINAYRNNGGHGKPVYLQFSFSYARSKQEAIMGAWDQWRSNLTSPENLANLTKPEQFDNLSKNISQDEISKELPIYTSIEELQEKIKELQKVNPSRIILHNVNRKQEDFIKDYGKVYQAY